MPHGEGVDGVCEVMRLVPPRPNGAGRSRAHAIATAVTVATVATVAAVLISQLGSDSIDSAIHTPASSGEYEYSVVFADEFNAAAGAPPDSRYWAFDLGGGGWGNDELQCYTNSARNASHSGHGTLHIVALREPGCAGRAYTSARITTKSKVEFGPRNEEWILVEARIRTPQDHGTWPAFWALGADVWEVEWPESGEIDIMETINGENWVHAGVHGPTNTGDHWTSGSSVVATPWRDFHIYQLWWKEDEIIVRFNEAEVFSINRAQLHGTDRKWVWSKPNFLILNVAVGGRWPGDPNSHLTRATMEVDYVRVFRVNGIETPTSSRVG